MTQPRVTVRRYFGDEPAGAEMSDGRAKARVYPSGYSVSPRITPPDPRAMCALDGVEVTLAYDAAGDLIVYIEPCKLKAHRPGNLFVLVDDVAVYTETLQHESEGG